MVLFPALTRADEATELDGMMARASRNLMFITLVTVVVAVAAVPVATPLVFGGEYADTIFGTCVMLIGSGFGVGFQVFSRYFTSRHLQHYNIAIASLGLLAAVACSLILIPVLGFEGAAWAFLAGQLAMGALPILVFLRISRRNIHEVLVIDGRDLVYMRDSFRRILARTS
jgi:O-antigen/teichoic acid export membrane protein